MKLALALPLCLALLPPAQAQTVQRQAQVWRCGPDGRDLRDAPCPGSAPASGAGTLVYDEPSEADRRAAQARQQADARQAAALAAGRDAREADALQRNRRATGLQASPGSALPAARPAAAASAPRRGPRPPKPPKAQRPPPPAQAAPAASASSAQRPTRQAGR